MPAVGIVIWPWTVGLSAVGVCAWAGSAGASTPMTSAAMHARLVLCHGCAGPRLLVSGTYWLVEYLVG